MVIRAGIRGVTKTMNSVQCLKCGTILISLNRHDFVQCECENKTFTDGGEDYQRYGGKDLKSIKILGSPK